MGVQLNLKNFSGSAYLLEGVLINLGSDYTIAVCFLIQEQTLFFGQIISDNCRTQEHNENDSAHQKTVC
jgi:hypothetical protein